MLSEKWFWWWDFDGHHLERFVIHDFHDQVDGFNIWESEFRQILIFSTVHKSKDLGDLALSLNKSKWFSVS